MRTAVRFWGWSVGALWFVGIGQAFAGGFELPDNGTEALGRGGAFTAKADDGTAMTYNIAGFAQQRGTKLMLDTNLWFSDYSFQRAGNYVDSPQNTLTPWGGSRYPKVSDQSGMFPEPMFAASTDFGYFDRWTFFLGAFGPSAIANRTFPQSLGFAPNPGRYDIVENHPQVIFATVGAAVRALPWLDIGAALHYTIANVHVSQVALTDAVAHGTGPGQCANNEYAPCDARSTLDTNGGGVTGSLGVLARPIKEVSLGINVRGPVKLDTNGEAATQTPRVTPNTTFQDSPAEFVVRLPTQLRFGARYSFLEKRWDETLFERADIELDGTWENWGAAQGGGFDVKIPKLNATNPPPGINLTNIDFLAAQTYHDTWSIRFGGAYNIPLRNKMILALRAGVYHDSSATDPAWTRLDFDTLAKTAGTVGAGLKWNPFELNVAYGEIWDAARTVQSGELRPINGALQGKVTDATGALYPAVNNGHYEGHTRVLSLGVTVYFDGWLIGKQRHEIAPPPGPAAITQREPAQ